MTISYKSKFLLTVLSTVPLIAGEQTAMEKITNNTYITGQNVLRIGQGIADVAEKSVVGISNCFATVSSLIAQHPKTAAALSAAGIIFGAWRVGQHVTIKRHLDRAHFFCGAAVLHTAEPNRTRDMLRFSELDLRNVAALRGNAAVTKRDEINRYLTYVRELRGNLQETSLLFEWLPELAQRYHIELDMNSLDSVCAALNNIQIDHAIRVRASALGCPQYYPLLAVPNIWMARFYAPAQQGCDISFIRSLTSALFKPYEGCATLLVCALHLHEKTMRDALALISG